MTYHEDSSCYNSKGIEYAGWSEKCVTPEKQAHEEEKHACYQINICSNRS